MTVRYSVMLAAALALCGCAASPEPPLEGERLTRLYVAIEDLYRADAKFRTDYDPDDAPYDSEQLADNFVFVAQRSETQTAGSGVLVEGKSIPLSRWTGPLRTWTLGATEEDLQHLDTLARRVIPLTGLSITPAKNAQEANVYVLITDAEERRQMSTLLSSLGRSQDAPMLRAWPDLAEYPCIARVFVDPETNSVDWALIFIKEELRGDFRRSCLTEEFVQSLGLFNDGSQIRPSIFNDDGEFIELTRHDEYLLRILYDGRLRPGMTREEAEPIVRTIAAELLSERET